MNWFQKMMLVLLLFIGMLSYMVYRSNKVQLDLVTDTYYEEEIRYQHRIDDMANADQLQQQVVIEKKEKDLHIAFPAGMENEKIKGKVGLYFAADKNKDKEIDLSPDESLQQNISMSGMRGMYAIQVSWQYNGKSFYTEKKIMF
jgi:hypothetical protein